MCLHAERKPTRFREYENSFLQRNYRSWIHESCQRVEKTTLKNNVNTKCTTADDSHFDHHHQVFEPSYPQYNFKIHSQFDYPIQVVCVSGSESFAMKRMQSMPETSLWFY